MTGDANLFDDRFLADLNAALDAVVADDTSMSLVLTGAGKYFSNGFDLEFLGRLQGPELMAFIRDAQLLVSRVLTFPVPTVAVVNGHAFGIAAMLAVAHDVRVMRSDRGWFCLPEIDLGLPFQPFMTALLRALGSPTAPRRKQCSPAGATPEMRRSRPASPTKPSSSRRCSSARSRSRLRAAARAAKSPRRSSGICTHRCCPHSREAGGRISGELTRVRNHRRGCRLLHQVRDTWRRSGARRRVTRARRRRALRRAGGARRHRGAQGCRRSTRGHPRVRPRRAPTCASAPR